MPMHEKGDPTQPSVKSLEIVRNKNNAAELALRRQLDHYDREKSLSIMNIDHDRLDTKDFLRDIRACTSDDLPEAKLWLGGGFRPPSRNVFTAPAGGRRKADEDEPPPEEESHSDDEENKLGNGYLDKIRSMAKIHMDIFSKRNEYSNIQRPIIRPLWPGMESMFDELGNVVKQENKGVTFEEGSKEQGDDGDIYGAGGASRSQSRMGTTAPSTRVGTPVDLESMRPKDSRSSSRRHRSGATTSQSGPRDAKGDFMKELLVKNAKRKYKKSTKGPPLNERISDFFDRIDDIKNGEAKAAKAPVSTEIKRKMALMTKGVGAAMAIKGDGEEEEDDNPLNTV